MFQIRKDDINKYGATETCTGCEAARNGQNRPHTNECRSRFEDIFIQVGGRLKERVSQAYRMPNDRVILEEEVVIPEDVKLDEEQHYDHDESKNHENPQDHQQDHQQRQCEDSAERHLDDE